MWKQDQERDSEHNILFDNGSLPGSGGTGLEWQAWTPKHGDPLAAIFYVHGLQSHPDWLWPSSSTLCEHSVAVFAAARRGSGRSKGERGRFNVGEVIEDYTKAWDFFNHRFGCASVLLGQSFGGSVATALLTQNAIRPDSVCLVAPALGQQRHRGVTEQSFANHDDDSFIQVDLMDRDYTSNIAHRRAMANDQLMLRQIRGCSRRAMFDIERLYTEHTSPMDVPALLLQPRLDSIINSSASRDEFRRLFSRRSERLFDTTEHYLEFSSASEATLNTIISFAVPHDVLPDGYIDVTEARYPMREFLHATKSRESTESVLVRISHGGALGWGEGAPRSYVTGESMESASGAIISTRGYREKIPVALSEPDWDSACSVLWELDCGAMTPNGTPVGPSAAAALELATIDLVCRKFEKPITTLLHRWLGASARAPEPFPVSMVLGLGSDTEEVRKRFDSNPPKHVKLKGGKDHHKTINLINAVNAMIQDNTTLSVDANGIWTPEQTREVHTSTHCVSWFEEPIEPRNWGAMRQLRTDGLKVMLDESAVHMNDLYAAKAEDAFDLINIRVSKCGGLRKAIEMIKYCDEHGKGYQIGVHPGEIGPLFAAGRALAATVAHAKTAEAGQQEYWFQEDLTIPPYGVGKSKGLVQPPDGPGLGFEPNDAAVRFPDFRRVHISRLV